MYKILKDCDALDFLVDLERKDIITLLSENKDKMCVGFDSLHKVSTIVDMLKLDKLFSAWKFIYMAVIKYPTGEIDIVLSNTKKDLKILIEHNRQVLNNISNETLNELFSKIENV